MPCSVARWRRWRRRPRWRRWLVAPSFGSAYMNTTPSSISLAILPSLSWLASVQTCHSSSHLSLSATNLRSAPLPPPILVQRIHPRCEREQELLVLLHHPSTIIRALRASTNTRVYVCSRKFRAQIRTCVCVCKYTPPPAYVYLERITGREREIHIAMCARIIYLRPRTRREGASIVCARAWSVANERTPSVGFVVESGGGGVKGNRVLRACAACRRCTRAWMRGKGVVCIYINT